MASKAKKLPSGSWRAQVSYKGTDGKRHFQSFTASTKKEAEYMAAEFEMEKDRINDSSSWTLGEAIDHYIELKEPLLSPSTIQGYRKIRCRSFQNIMSVPLKKVTTDILQEAVLLEMERPRVSRKKDGSVDQARTQSAKSVKNAYGLVSAALARYMPERVFRVDLPRTQRRIRTLPDAESIFKAVKGSRIELACLLAMWLSFSESEVRGLTKSKSLDGDYITVQEVVIYAGSKQIRKDLAKTDKRKRRHKLPPYIKQLIDQVDGDVIVPYTPRTLLDSLQRCLRKAGLPEITFHDLRHVNASVMALLHVPDVYAQERGGWASDNIMKTVYTETFSRERQAVDAVIDGYFQGFVG